MKVANRSFISLKDLSDNLDLTNLDVAKTLIQVFSGLTAEAEIRQIQSIFARINPDASFVGTTTAGEIVGSSANENTILVSIVQFEHTTVDYSCFDNCNDDYALGVNVARALIGPNTKSLLVFADGLSTNGSDLVDGISSVNRTIPISGGLAGDDGTFVKTCVFGKQHIYTRGCVAASLNSEILELFTDYRLNWQPVGQLMTITKVDKKRLYEINGIPASDVYRKYLGDKVGGNLPYSATEFPLLKIADDGTEVCRTFVDLFDDGSLLMTGNLEVGDRVRLAFGNVDLITRNTSKKAMEYREHQPEVVFVYNCASRKSFLQSRVMSEIEPLAEIAPVCGFFTYGEFFSHNNKSALLNITLTILGLREKERADIEPLVVPQSTKDELEKNTFSNKSFLVLEALTALSTKVIEELNQANKELEETKEKLEQLASTDKLTGVFNRSRLDYFLRHQMDECRRYNKTFGFAILDVDHFKRINDNHGHLVGDIALKEIATLIKTSIRCSDIFGRWGGEEFVLILPQATSEAMKGLLEKIRVMISRYPIDKAGPQTISIGATQFQPEDTVDQIIKRADDALYEAKNKGRNRVFIR